MRFALAVVLTACSSFDPTFGVRHVEPSGEGEVDDASGPAPSDDAATDASPADAPLADARGGVDFHRDIRPLMNRAGNDPTGKGCKSCHYSTEANH